SRDLFSASAVPLTQITGATLTDLTASPAGLIFVSRSGAQEELWISEGSHSRTERIATYPIQTEPRIQLITVGAGGIFFAVNDDVHAFEIWRTDGTTAGTKTV